MEGFRALKELYKQIVLNNIQTQNQGTCPNKQEMLLYANCKYQSLKVGAERKYNKQVRIKGHE